MTKEIEIFLPKLGESIVNATIVKWLKNEGDLVQKDEALLEVATDKLNSEIPSPVSGRIKKIVAFQDEEKQVGDLLAIIVTEEDMELTEEMQKEEIEAPLPSTESSDFYSPAVLKIAKQYHISLDQLDKLNGTGNEGRVTKKDIIRFAEQKKGREVSQGTIMSPMRKAIADNMVKSFYRAPHASLITEVDMTDLVDQIEQQRETFFEKTGAKLSITSFVALAIAKSLPSFAYLNSSCDKDMITLKEYVNLGIAVHVEDGLVVPVIKNAEKLDLTEMAKKIYSFAEKARSKQLKAEDLQGGSVTLTNYGTTGIDMGLPIIRYPEAAIIGMGAIKNKPMAIEERIVIRSMMNLSVTFDHRVCDGIYSCAFLNQIKTFLENYHD